MLRILLLSVLLLASANAHFLTLTAQTDYVSKKQQSSLELFARFIHPFEQTAMVMQKPKGIYVNGKETPLPLKQSTAFGKKAWKAAYTIKRPGLYSFFVQPQPYFEPAEGKFISHVPKLLVSGFGIESGWDEPLGLEYEIVPLTKPFGLYAGNLFQGRVLVHGKPKANAEVEVELLNTKGYEAPTDAHITQVVKTDDNGIFSFVMPHKGWWGFAALIEEGELTFEGQNYPVENGALLWIKAY